MSLNAYVVEKDSIITYLKQKNVPFKEEDVQLQLNSRGLKLFLQISGSKVIVVNTLLEMYAAITYFQGPRLVMIYHPEDIEDTDTLWSFHKTVVVVEKEPCIDEEPRFHVLVMDATPYKSYEEKIFTFLSELRSDFIFYYKLNYHDSKGKDIHVQTDYCNCATYAIAISNYYMTRKQKLYEQFASRDNKRYLLYPEALFYLADNIYAQNFFLTRFLGDVEQLETHYKIYENTYIKSLTRDVIHKVSSYV